MVGRDRELERILGLLDDRWPALAVTGPLGIGRSELLANAGRQLAKRGVRVAAVACSASEADTRYGLLYRVISAIDPRTQSGRSAPAGLPPLLDLAARASTFAGQAAPMLAGHLAAALAGDLGRRGPLLLLIDDIQWADRATLQALRPLARRSMELPWRLVFTMRTSSHAPAKTPPGPLAELVAEGLTDWLPLAPLTPAEADTVLADRLGARPEPELVQVLHERSMGNPLGLVAAAEGYQRSGALHLIDGHALLSRPDADPQLSMEHPLLREIVRLGQHPWVVARSLAAVAALGPCAASLVAEATALGESTVAEALTTLVDHGILGRDGAGWSFRLPVVAGALRALLAPVERQRIHAAAAAAILDERVSAPHQNFLPDCLAVPGASRSQDEAGPLLVAAAERIIGTDNDRAASWLAAATPMLPAATRSQVRVLRAHACLAASRWSEAVTVAYDAITDQLLNFPGAADASVAASDDEKTRELWGLVTGYVRGLAASGNHAVLTDFADRGWAELPVPAAWRQVARAIALVQLERLHELDEVLTSSAPLWTADPVVATSGWAARTIAALVRGRTAEFHELSRTRPTQNTPLSRLTYLNARLQRASALVLVDELAEPTALLAEDGMSLADLQISVRVLAEFHAGRWDEAMRLSRQAEARWADGLPPLSTSHTRTVPARILAARGQFNRARTWLDRGREMLIGTEYLAYGGAEIHTALGEFDEAAALLTQGIADADAIGSYLNRDAMLALLIEIHTAAGHHQLAAKTLTELDHIASKVDTDRAALNLLRGKTIVHGRESDAKAAIALANRRGLPFELATTYLIAAPRTDDTATLLESAYDLFGTLDSRPWRSTTRAAMRIANVPVPGRAEAADETDRLLAQLVADGFGNKRIAHVLNTSQRGVEGRVSRLLARTGYRSRVELAGAVLTDQLKW